jgi:hypothetical protein
MNTSLLVLINSAAGVLIVTLLGFAMSRAAKLATQPTVQPLVRSRAPRTDEHAARQRAGRTRALATDAARA